MTGWPDLSGRIERATEMAEAGIVPARATVPAESFAETWIVGPHRVVLWPHGGWGCDCTWGEHHGGEQFNPCAHTILAATHSALGLDRFTMPPPRVVKPVPDDPFEGLTG